MNEPILQCSACGKTEGDDDVIFSNNQRKRALFLNEPARCTICVVSKNKKSSSVQQEAVASKITQKKEEEEENVIQAEDNDEKMELDDEDNNDNNSKSSNNNNSSSSSKNNNNKVSLLDDDDTIESKTTTKSIDGKTTTTTITSCTVESNNDNETGKEDNNEGKNDDEQEEKKNHNNEAAIVDHYYKDTTKNESGGNDKEKVTTPDHEDVVEKNSDKNQNNVKESEDNNNNNKDEKKIESSTTATGIIPRKDSVRARRKAIENDDDEGGTDIATNAATMASRSSRRKRNNKPHPRSRNTIYDNDDDDNTDDDGINDTPNKDSVSIDKLKQKIMGRRLITADNDAPTNDSNKQYSPMFSQMSSIDEEKLPQLRRELLCAICHEILYQPISLHCGHSFCSECLKWWLDHNKGQGQQQNQQLNTSTCPTCRQTILTSSSSSFNVNMALRACIEVLMGNELQKRIRADQIAKRTATAGENNGEHDRGYEIMKSINECEWKSVRGKTKRYGTISARRSIVLDEQDQRMQLALALRIVDPNSPAIHINNNGIIQISICLLTMEEDEVSDYGFPLILSIDEDEHFLVRESRLYSAIDLIAVNNNNEENENKNNENENNNNNENLLPVSRRVLGSECVVQFTIDTKKYENITLYRFIHEECNAALEIQLPKEGRIINEEEHEEDDYEIHDTLGNTDHFVEEQYDDSEEEEHMEEDDGFIADERSDIDDEDDDEDVCCICNEGGEMIVCDGGDHIPGCGCYFHVHCIDRTEIPPGDWICKGCANNEGYPVGIEGHEYPPNEVIDKKHDNEDEDRSDREVDKPSKLKRIQKQAPDIDSSDEEAFEQNNFSPQGDGDDDDESDDGNNDNEDADKPAKLKKRIQKQAAPDLDSSDEEAFDQNNFSPQGGNDDNNESDDDNNNGERDDADAAAASTDSKRKRTNSHSLTEQQKKDNNVTFDSDDDDDDNDPAIVAQQAKKKVKRSRPIIDDSDDEDD